jgi:hypothetical protein
VDKKCAAPYGCGVVFELSPQADGTWTSQVLTTFYGPNGATPLGLALDATGNVFAAVANGGIGGCINGFGPNGCGLVIELSPAAGGGFTRTGLKKFKGVASAFPEGVSLDAAGNVWGATECSDPGCTTDGGAVFKLTPSAGGGYAFSFVHKFKGGSDGFEPLSAPTVGPNGDLYGAAPLGGGITLGQCGIAGCGVVYQITP